MTRFLPDWDKAHAQETFDKYKDKHWKRPTGKAVYELVSLGELVGTGWGIRVRRVDRHINTSYIICHNAILAEKWTEA